MYYSEGNLYRELKQYDKAVEMFEKSAEIDPKYFYAPFSIGDLYYTMALDIQEKAASELDDAKYNKMNEQLNECLKKAIEPFTKAFNLTDDKQNKEACAEYLKNIYFRFKDESPENEALYNKYNKFLQEGE